jgi:hypothetical protein
MKFLYLNIAKITITFSHKSNFQIQVRAFTIPWIHMTVAINCHILENCQLNNIASSQSAENNSTFEKHFDN